MADLSALTFEIIRDRLPGWTLEQWREATACYEFLPVEVKGETVGAIMARGPELHVSILPAHRCKWMSKKILRFIRDRAERFGAVETLVKNNHEAGHKFAKRLGFIQVDQSDAVTIYRMEYAR